jgi:lipopolysaccharide transport system ATP-binding protein
MADDLAISVEGLSKCYRVGHQAHSEAHATLRDQIVRHARNLARKTRDMASGQLIVQGDTVEDFWALRDVSFDIPRGARVGILGRNGAGKSTLLKLLSRITEPSSGRIKINGRVASLLEVGTGFHPELSGRENIFLNGAILGMSRREIQSRFDEIVEFAEVERFLDTPVKRYSSGMYVRLAFAVAAHLEPEILIVDEVLAVGDVQFQKKCLGKMQSVADSGRTVLFVSHNLAAIESLTTHCVLLQSGRVAAHGRTSEVVAQYLQKAGSPNQVTFDTDSLSRKYAGNEKARIVQLRLTRPTPVFAADEDFRFVAVIRGAMDADCVRVSMTVFANDGTPVGSSFGPGVVRITAGGVHEIEVVLRSPCLAPGAYYCGLSVGTGDHRTGHVDFDVVLDTLNFEVRPPAGEDSTAVSWPRNWGTIVFAPLEMHAGASQVAVADCL